MAVFSNKQTGTASILFFNTSVTVTLGTPVASLSSSILMFSVKILDAAGSVNPQKVFISGKFISTSQIVFTRNGNGTILNQINPTIEWQVLEFSSGVTVQHKTLTLITSATTTSVAITSVDITKSWIIGTYNCGASTLTNDAFIRSRFTNIVGSNSTQVTADRSTSGGFSTIELQVVTYDSCSVQYNQALNFPGGSAIVSDTLSTAVNTSKTAMFMSYSASYISPPDQNDSKCVLGELFNSTTVRFWPYTFIDALSSATISYFTVEFTDSTVVQSSNWGLLPGINSTSISYSPAIVPSASVSYFVGLNNTIGAYNNSFDSNFVQGSATVVINNSTTGTMSRGSASSTYDLTQSIFTITFATGASYSRYKKDGVLLGTTFKTSGGKLLSDGVILNDTAAAFSDFVRNIADGVILGTLPQHFFAQAGTVLLRDGIKVSDFLNIINAQAQTIDGAIISDSAYAAFVGDPPTDMAANLVIAKTTSAEYLLDWDIDTTGVKNDFVASIDIYKTLSSDFSASICVQRDFQVGVVGQTLSGNPNSPIGFFPMCSASGFVVTKQLNYSISATYDGADPGTLYWSYGKGDDPAAGRGLFEWGSVSIVGQPTEIEALSSGYDIRQKIIIENPPSGASGIFHRTIIYDGAIEPSHGQFTNLPSGTYVAKFMLKQSCNPNPYILTSGFVVGPVGWYDLFVARSPGKEGVNPYTVNFYSSRSDVREPSDPTEMINWDFGTYDIWGNDNQIYREPTTTFRRQGFYNPVVTYVLKDGYRLSKEVPEVSFAKIGDGVILSTTMTGSNFHYVLGITNGLIVSDANVIV